MHRIYQVLEYTKIIDLLCERVVCTPARQKAQTIQPSYEFSQVSYLQEQTDQAVSMLLRRGNAPITPISDILPALKRCDLGSSCSLSELLNIAAVLRLCSSMTKYLKEGAEFTILNGIAQTITPLPTLEKQLGDSILGEDELADQASAELYSLRRRKGIIGGKIRDILNDMVHSPKYTKYLQDPIITMRGDRYVLPVKSEAKQSVPGILHDTSSSGATLFIEPMAVVQANNQLREVIVQEKEECQRIIFAFCAEIAENSDLIRQSFDSLLDLDVLFAKAKLALDYECSRPVLQQECVLSIKQGRHPLIGKQKVIPIDVSLGKDFDVLVITGPNTGGKTVSLKTVGLFALMTQSGLQIPAANGSKMPVFDNVFADIGDEQSIEQSLSTFSSHMRNIVGITTDVTRGSLVLFDELGAGTDPEEGAALAIEILEFVKKNGAKVIATTHYSELKLYALKTPRVENASCEFDIETLMPTYRLLIGVPGKSNAFAISKRLGLFGDIISSAKGHISDENARFEDVIADLHKKQEAAAQALSQAQTMRAQAQQEMAAHQKQNSDIRDKKRKILDAARQEAQSIIEQAREETSDLLKQVQKMAQSVQSRDDVKEMERLRSKLTEKGKKTYGALTMNTPSHGGAPADQVKPGVTVKILSFDEEGTVLAPPDKNGDFMAQMGIMKIKVNLNDALIVKQESKINGQKVSTISSPKRSANTKTELDLRGQRVEEGLSMLDRFIDDAVMSSLEQISIIHGKGTGAMRQAVQDFLKHNPYVKSTRLGEYGEGDSGITIAKLK